MGMSKTKNHKTVLIEKVLTGIFLALLTHPTVIAQTVGWGVQAFGFFDNSEGDDQYRWSGTFSGIYLQPQLSVSSISNKHRLVMGYDALLESGAKPEIGADGILGYYQYQHRDVRFLLGKFPRRLQQETMPDYLIMDSIRYFRPNITGFDFLYSTSSAYVEAFLDWTAKRDSNVREQFMAGLMARYRSGWFQTGIDGYYYHYAKEQRSWRTRHQAPHDNFLMHPYVGLSQQQVWLLDSLGLRTGMLINFDRDRETDKQWHVPIGFLGELGARWKKVGLSQLVYIGQRQQYYGEAGRGKYYWGDAYYRSPYYLRTDLTYQFLLDRYASLKCGLAFHMTDKGVRWNQMLQLNVSFGR